jgi:preprotein translocase subunit SecD
MRRNRPTSLVVIVLAAVFGLLYTFAAGNSAQLGLDLQGGASVTLQPPPGTPRAILDQAIEIIRSRVDALGVAEPQITRQGSAVVVELPGVKDQERAVALVGTTAELRFRPVLGVVDDASTSTTTTAPTTTTSAPGKGSTSSAATTPSSTTTTVPPGTTSRDDNKADAIVVLPNRQGKGEPLTRYQLGPAALLGKAVSGASAKFNSAEWSVELRLHKKDQKIFNALAGQCFSRSPSCPTNQLAIELDGVVESAPVFQADTFSGPVVISGNFSEKDAKNLALVLRYGSLPVKLETQAVRTVSPTLGRDSLRAGLIAGLLGAALVFIYMAFYYRLLGLVVLAGMAIWFALQWTIISYLGETSGLALSLAGVTGIVVSIGVTVDSYVVYFERIKDEVRSGRTMRSAVDRGFQKAFRTIIAADATSFIGAVILYTRTVGAVRGFAFFLGLSTLLDVVKTYMFTRPVVSILARRGHFDSSSFIGVTTAKPAAEVDAPATEGATS